MANRWSVEEETLLAQAWVAVHEDHVIHNAMSFWHRVVAIFNDRTDGVNRNRDMVMSKWSRLNCECVVFNGIYQHLRRTTLDDHNVYVRGCRCNFFLLPAPLTHVSVPTWVKTLDQRTLVGNRETLDNAVEAMPCRHNASFTLLLRGLLHYMLKTFKYCPGNILIANMIKFVRC